MEKITKENCLEILRKIDYQDVKSQQDKAWGIVYNFCVQNGMKTEEGVVMELVIGFIESLLKKEERVPGQRSDTEEFEVVTCDCCQQKVPLEFTYSDDEGNYICPDCINDRLNFLLIKKDRKIKKLKKKNKRLQEDIVLLQITNPHQA